MSTKKPTNPILDAARLAIHDEARAVAFFEEHRWHGNVACPRLIEATATEQGRLCGSTNVYMVKDRKTGQRNVDFRWRCRDCGEFFTVRTGMVFAETRLPMRVWAFAFWKACASKKGVSALQIKRECEISYKSALF